MSLFQTVKSTIQKHQSKSPDAAIAAVHQVVTENIKQDIQPEFNGIAALYQSHFPSENGADVESYMLASALEVLSIDTGAPVSDSMNTAKATLNSHIKDILAAIDYLKHHPEDDPGLSAEENARLHELRIHTLNKAWVTLDKAYDRLNTASWVVDSSFAAIK